MGVRLHVRSCWASRSEAEAVYELEQSRILIGRGRGVDVRLPHRSVSVRHATIELVGTRYTIVDHATTNGTRVQGSPIVPGRPKPVRDGDRIEIGGFAIVFRSGVPVGRSTSEERTASLARQLVREALNGEHESLRPFLTVLNGPEQGRVVPLGKPPTRSRIGRGPECELVLRDADLSREHAEIDVNADGVWLRDLNSKNGIMIGDRQVVERRLEDRDELRIGATVIRFEDPAVARVEMLEAGDDEAVSALPTWEQIVSPPPDGDAVKPQVAAEDVTATPLPEPAKRHAAIAPADMVIYVLASLVFAVSVLGLVWLLGS